MRSPGDAAKHLVDRIRSMVKLELEQVAGEAKRKVAAVGLGIGLLLAAVLFAFFAVAFALATIAAAIATTLAVWLALLIVTATLLVVIVLLVVFGIRAIRKAKAPDGTGATEKP